MTLAERNEMRIQICELNVELEQLPATQEQYRSADKVAALRDRIEQLEAEIRHDLEQNGSS